MNTNISQENKPKESPFERIFDVLTTSVVSEDKEKKELVQKILFADKSEKIINKYEKLKSLLSKNNMIFFDPSEWIDVDDLSRYFLENEDDKKTLESKIKTEYDEIRKSYKRYSNSEEKEDIAQDSYDNFKKQSDRFLKVGIKMAFMSSNDREQFYTQRKKKQFTKKELQDLDEEINLLDNYYDELFIQYLQNIYKSSGIGNHTEDTEYFESILHDHYHIYGIVSFAEYMLDFSNTRDLLMKSLLSFIFTPIYSNIFLSVLKCESFIDDKFSREKIIDGLREIINEYFKEKYNTSYGSSQTGDLPIYEKCLETLSTVCNSYIYLNRKIELFISGQPVVLIDYAIKHNYMEQLNYADFITSTKTKEGGILRIRNFPEFFSRTLPYLFEMLSEVTALDINFVVDKEAVGQLLNAYYTFDEIIKLLSKENNNVDDDDDDTAYSQLIESIFDPIKRELIKTLHLAKSKASFLLYKTIRSDKSNILRSFQYIVNNKICSFDKEYDAKNIKNNRKSIVDLIEEDEFKEESFILTLFEINKRGGQFDQNELIRKYEQYLNEILCSKTLEKNYLSTLCNNLNSEYVKDSNPIIVSSNSKNDNEYNDIKSYNDNIIKMINSNFIMFTDAIKTLKNIEDSNEPDVISLHISKVDHILDKRDKKDKVSSCSFLFKHIDWCIKKIGYILANQKYNEDIGFKLIKLCDRLIAEANKLNTHIESGFYSASYASLFQDCFFSFPNKAYNYDLNIKQRLTDNSFENIKNAIYKKGSPYIFVASTWRQPISKSYMKNTIEKYSIKFEEYKSNYYNSYYRKVGELSEETNLIIKNNDKIVDEKIEENKRSTTQILGILAGFISLAAVSVSGSITIKDGRTFVVFISSITLCLVIFVLLLSFVIKKPSKNMIERVATRISLAVAIIVLAGIITINIGVKAQPEPPKEVPTTSIKAQPPLQVDVNIKNEKSSSGKK